MIIITIKNKLGRFFLFCVPITTCLLIVKKMLEKIIDNMYLWTEIIFSMKKIHMCKSCTKFRVIYLGIIYTVDCKSFYFTRTFFFFMIFMIIGSNDTKVPRTYNCLVAENGFFFRCFVVLFFFFYKIMRLSIID